MGILNGFKKYSIIAVSCFIVFSLPLHAETVPLNKLDETSLGKRADQDLHSVQIYRNGLQSVMNSLSQPDFSFLQKESKNKMLSAEEKETFRMTWKSFLDYFLALDSLGQYYSSFNELEGKETQKISFFVFYQVSITQYRFALDFINMAENNSALDTILNEPVAEIGLPAGTYDQFKFRFLNVIKATEFVSLNLYDKYFDFNKSDFLEARITLEEDKNAILETGKGTGEILTLKNAFDIVNKTGFKAWFPVQAGVSNWMGDTKVKRKENTLITQDQIKEILPNLEPGDIMLERREWYLSNVGLPGFWTHVAFFVGTPEERQKIFNTDEVKDWVKKQGELSGDFEKLLQNTYPKAYELNLKSPEGGHLPRVMEAIGEGVSFTTIEHSAAADSLGILRPKLSKKEKAIAIARAFNYCGRPYDFNFDFLTDASLVCSELTYKCYEPGNEYKGIKFNLVKMMGRLITPPNEIARQFDLEYGTKDQQMDFVLFFDGYEKANKSVNTGVEEFKESWKRPKWHILVKELPTGGK